eukprot:scaffold1723_cov104-Isochrysis_galbana.AAC.1
MLRCRMRMMYGCGSVGRPGCYCYSGWRVATVADGHVGAAGGRRARILVVLYLYFRVYKYNTKWIPEWCLGCGLWLFVVVRCAIRQFRSSACCANKGQRGEYSAGPWQSSDRLSAVCAYTAK